MPQQSVSLWIDQLKAGEHEPTEKLWERYFQSMLRLARDRLRGRGRLGADEEDVALSAFDSFFRGAAAGRFPQLNDREDLWHLLVTITTRKTCHLIRDTLRQKRGGGAVLGDSGLLAQGDTDAGQGFDQFIGRSPTPEFIVQLTEDYQRLFDLLDDDGLRTVASLKMEGFTIAEIAVRIGRATATVERRLKVIRALWEKDLEFHNYS